MNGNMAQGVPGLYTLGVSDILAYTSIRFGVGRFTTEEEMDFAAEVVIKTVKHLRSFSSLQTAV